MSKTVYIDVEDQEVFVVRTGELSAYGHKAFLTDEEYLAYINAVKEFERWQDKLDVLVNGGSQ